MNTLPARPRPQWILPLAVLATVLLAQAPLIFNPGYFSHDELQWAAHATVDAYRIPHAAIWADVQSFQYRPLTFSLWVVLSQRLFEHPFAFHAVIVGFGAVNAAMLALLLRGAGARTRTAAAGALVFALGPYAAHTHGWVGTLGDLIWVGCALACGLVVQRVRKQWWAALAIAGLTTAALLAKEAAVVIPALLGLAWLFDRRRVWAWATLAAAIPVAAYLSLRLGVILFSPREAANYGWSLAYVPQRWLEYQLFTQIPTRLGITGLWPTDVGGARFWLAALLWLGLAAMLWRAGARWLLGFVLAGTAALGPVLILTESANQYGYGFAAATAGVCALAWPRLRRPGRVLCLLLALLSLWHGANIVRRMHRIGELQATFSPAMAAAVMRAGSAPVVLRPADPDQHWIYLRLTHHIHAYHGVDIGERVRLVETGADADYEIRPNGVLQPLH